MLNVTLCLLLIALNAEHLSGFLISPDDEQFNLTSISGEQFLRRRFPGSKKFLSGRSSPSSLSPLGCKHLFDCISIKNVKGGVLAQVFWGSVTGGTLRAEAGLNLSIGSPSCVRPGTSGGKADDVLSQVWSLRLLTGAIGNGCSALQGPRLSFLSLCDGDLEPGSGSPKSHVVPSGSRDLQLSTDFGRHHTSATRMV